MLFGWRLNRLREKKQLLCKDRDLAGFCAAQGALDADDVAEVKAIRQVPACLANLFLADEQLNLPRLITNINELQTPRISQQYDAACGAYCWTDQLAFALFGEPAAKIEIRILVDIGQIDLLAIFRLELDFADSSANGSDGIFAIESTAPRINLHQKRVM